MWQEETIVLTLKNWWVRHDQSSMALPIPFWPPCSLSCFVLSYIILSYQESRPTNHAPWTMWRVKPELLSVPLPCCLPACVCLQWPDVLQSLCTRESQLQVSQHCVFTVNHADAMTRAFRVIDPLRGIHLARVADGYPHKEPIMRILIYTFAWTRWWTA